MSWAYVPVSIHLKPLAENAEACCISGIFVVDIAAKTKQGFCLSVCSLPEEQLRLKYEIWVAAPQFSDIEVIWSDSKSIQIFPIFKEASDPLLDHIKMCLSQGFSFLVGDKRLDVLSLSLVSILKFTCRISFDSMHRHHYEKLRLRRADAGSKLTIRSCPFSLNNSKLFADFRSTGYINMVIRDTERYWGYYSDLKYLNNMTGGVALNHLNYAIGLLAGNLRKNNGDGELAVILPIERLPWTLQVLLTSKTTEITDTSLNSHQIYVKTPRLPRKSSSKWKIDSKLSHAENNTTPCHLPVFPIVLTTRNEAGSWGSCVLLGREVFITNFHVIQAKQESEQVNCEIKLSENSSLQISQDDTIVWPFKHLDLAFIFLSAKNQTLISSIEPIGLESCKDAYSEEPVFAAGFGLVLGQKTIPMMSKGIVSSSLSMIPFKKNEFNKVGQKKIPCMTITSASCWNGSSGGGLFATDGSFLGLICCNAEVRVPLFVGIKESSRVEKVPKVSFCIPSSLILECYRMIAQEQVENTVLTDNLVDAWNLKSFHEDVTIRNAKL